MYPVTYLPVAERDLSEAIDYIVNKLNTPAAAHSLLTEYEKTVQRIAEFPYACGCTVPIGPCVMRSAWLISKNYIM